MLTIMRSVVAFAAVLAAAGEVAMSAGILNLIRCRPT